MKQDAFVLIKNQSHVEMLLIGIRKQSQVPFRVLEATLEIIDNETKNVMSTTTTTMTLTTTATATATATMTTT